MASILYEDIYSSFLGSVSDYSFIKLEQFEMVEVLQEYVHKALAGSYVRRQFESLKLDDDVQKLNYELRNSVDEDADKEFVINMVTNYMVYEWSKKQANNISLTAQMFAGAEQKFYSQSNHLEELLALRDSSLQIAKDYIVEHTSFNNSYLRGDK